MIHKPLLSIVVPAYNEADGLAAAIEVIRQHADPLGEVEYIVVDDGSSDETWQVIQKIAASHACVQGVRLSRNFGKDAAINAGLKATKGSAIVTIDADLQHPPDLIPRMFECWQAGAKVINTVKRTRENEGLVKAWMTRRYFGLFQRLAGIDVGNATDFKMLDREVVECLLALPERARYYRGLVGWVGLEQHTLMFDVAPRLSGNSKWSSTKLIRLALDSIVSFSTVPMHLMTLLGGCFAVLAVGLSIRTLWLWLAGSAVPGFSTVILLLIVIGSVLMIGLGIIGIYIAKIYEEVKRRPEFIIQQQTHFPENCLGIGTNQTDQPERLHPNGPELVREVSR